MKSEKESRTESANSPLDTLRSTAHEIATWFPHADSTGWHRRGVTPRGERVFNVASSLLLAMFAVGWSWSIANAKPGSDVPEGVNPAAARFSSALTNGESPSLAYLTDAMLESVVPKGESGKL